MIQPPSRALRAPPPVELFPSISPNINSPTLPAPHLALALTLAVFSHTLGISPILAPSSPLPPPPIPQLLGQLAIIPYSFALATHPTLSSTTSSPLVDLVSQLMWPLPHSNFSSPPPIAPISHPHPHPPRPPSRSLLLLASQNFGNILGAKGIPPPRFEIPSQALRDPIEAILEASPLASQSTISEEFPPYGDLPFSQVLPFGVPFINGFTIRRRLQLGSR
ncbi:hypothetical protein AMTR_s00028p00234500 [Amborella trichopoda]|uniref:Uncharacterized protein n=1 Tax=Amborella trichopoda TaxID=13333 RepID=W1PRL8_AMBTC|nr:hypothetical protein AMTR_s00028p00234500 [Amborella trichopoda]